MKNKNQKLIRKSKIFQEFNQVEIRKEQLTKVKGGFIIEDTGAL